MTEDPREMPVDFRIEEVTELQPALERIAAALEASVYVEDMAGRLLFSNTRALSDSWRSEFTPFSLSDHPQRDDLLARWRPELGLYKAKAVDLDLQEYRVVIPLTYQGDLFALIHVVSTRAQLLSSATHPSSVRAIGDKLYIVIVGTMNAMRGQYLAPEEQQKEARSLPRQQGSESRHFRVISVHFGDHGTVGNGHDVIDYTSVAAYHALSLVSSCDLLQCSNKVALRTPQPQKSSLSTALIIETSTRGSHVPVPVEDLLQSAVESAGWRVTIGVSALFSDVEEARERAEHAEQVRDLGARQQGSRSVYTQQDIGVEAFLLPLTRSAELRSYAYNLMETLRQKDYILLQTLEAYIALDCNATRAAEYLRVDRRTIAYRLGRISEALGLDLGSFENKVLLYLALKATQSQLG